MQQLVQMDKEQTRSVEILLKKIGMEDYLAHFQMLINGTVNPADVLRLLITFYQTGYMKGSTAAYEAENTKLRAIQSYIRGLGSSK